MSCKNFTHEQTDATNRPSSSRASIARKILDIFCWKERLTNKKYDCSESKQISGKIVTVLQGSPRNTKSRQAIPDTTDADARHQAKVIRLGKYRQRQRSLEKVIYFGTLALVNLKCKTSEANFGLICLYRHTSEYTAHAVKQSRNRRYSNVVTVNISYSLYRETRTIRVTRVPPLLSKTKIRTF